MTLIGIGLSITRPYLSLFATNVIHMTPVKLGAFLCANALGGVVASTWLGKLSDSHRPKKDIILISSLCAGLGYGSFVFLHNYFILLFATTALLGFGSAAFPLMFAYARESAVSTQAGDSTFAISTLRSFFSLAWVIGPLAGAWVLSSLSYDGLFISTAAIFAVVFIVTLRRLKRRPSAGITAPTQISVLSNLKRFDVLTSCISFIAVYTAMNVNGIYMPLFVTKTLHAPQHVVGWVVSLSAGLEIPIMLVLGSLAMRIGKRTLLLAGAIFGGAYYVGCIFAYAAWQVLALQLFCALYIAINVSIGMSYFQDFMPTAPGSATTLYSNTSNVGAMLGSLIGGVIAQAFGFRAVYWFCALLSVVSYVFLLRRKMYNEVYGTS